MAAKPRVGAAIRRGIRRGVPLHSARRRRRRPRPARGAIHQGTRAAHAVGAARKSISEFVCYGWRRAAITRGMPARSGSMRTSAQPASSAATWSRAAEAQLHHQPAAGAQHARGVGRNAVVDFEAGLAGEQRHVRLPIAHLALQAVALAERNVGRVGDDQVHRAGARWRPSGRRPRCPRARPAARAFPAATARGGRRDVRGPGLGAGFQLQRHRQRARAGADIEDALARRRAAAPHRAARTSTTCSVSGRGISTSGVTRNSRP